MRVGGGEPDMDLGLPCERFKGRAIGKGERVANLLDEGIRAILGYLVPLVEAFGALVIVVGAVRTIVKYLRACLEHSPDYMTSLRIQLGQNMVMGLEFLVAADILRTALTPTWNEMLLLATLIGLRTVLNYFVERELKALDSDTPSSDYINPLFRALARQRDDREQES
jgi:uncharacterized membrane protein